MGLSAATNGKSSKDFLQCMVANPGTRLAAFELGLFVEAASLAGVDVIRSCIRDIFSERVADIFTSNACVPIEAQDLAVLVCMGGSVYVQVQLSRGTYGD